MLYAAIKLASTYLNIHSTTEHCSFNVLWLFVPTASDNTAQIITQWKSIFNSILMSSSFVSVCQNYLYGSHRFSSSLNWRFRIITTAFVHGSCPIRPATVILIYVNVWELSKLICVGMMEEKCVEQSLKTTVFGLGNVTKKSNFLSCLRKKKKWISIWQHIL